MKNVLVIEASFQGEKSHSKALVRDFLRLWKNKYPQDAVVARDLAVTPLPHMDNVLFGAMCKKDPATLTLAEEEALRRSDTVINDVKKADVLLFGAPVYNFNLASTLKAWIEHLLRVGDTFIYTEKGAVGLIDKNKKVFVISTIGGIYDDGAIDHQTNYLRYVFEFLGLIDVTFIHAEGLDMGKESREQGLQKARNQIEQIIGSL